MKPMSKYFVQKIISGGQTGADRAALDIAIALNIPHGGWCPKWRTAEDGVIPLIYQLQETPTADYSVRTARNVRDSHGTLIFTIGAPTGGTLLTLIKTKALRKWCFTFDLSKTPPPIDAAFDWIKEKNIRIINIAGPRASQVQDIHNLVYGSLQQLFVKLENQVELREH